MTMNLENNFWILAVSLITLSGENKAWTLESSFKMNSSGALRYAYIAPKCEAAFIESAKSLELVEGPKLETTVTDESAY